jgi:hypothetical protein
MYRNIIWLVVFYWVGGCLVAQELSDQERESVLNKLKTQWKSQSKAVATAHVTYRHIPIAKAWFKKKDKKELINDIDKYSRSITLSSFFDLVRSISIVLDEVSGDELKESESWLGNHEMFFDGICTKIIERVESSQNGFLEFYISPVNSIQVFRQNNQVSLYNSSDFRWRFLGFESFRMFPEMEKSKINEVISIDKGIVSLKYDDYILKVDQSTSLVFEAVKKDSGGDVSRIGYQFGTIVLKNNIVFPKSFILAEFQEGQCVLMDIVLIEDIAVNTNIPKSEFSAAIPEGFRAFNFRENKNSPKEIDVNRDVQDIVKFLEEKNSSESTS